MTFFSRATHRAWSITLPTRLEHAPRYPPWATRFRNIETLNLSLIARPLNGGYPYRVLPSGGLIDPVTSALILLGLAGALLQWRRPMHMVVLIAILLPMPAAAITLNELSEVYRLNGMVPALFLAAALSLDQAAATARKYARAAAAGLLVLAVWCGAVNTRQAASYVTEDRTMCSLTDVYSSVRAAYIALAVQTDALGADSRRIPGGQ